jgi:hypothetical protein
MPGVLACIVCARPLDALLTGGLHAGVAVLALTAIVVLAAVAAGVARLLREDAAILSAESASAAHLGGTGSAAASGRGDAR